MNMKEIMDYLNSIKWSDSEVKYLHFDENDLWVVLKDEPYIIHVPNNK